MNPDVADSEHVVGASRSDRDLLSGSKPIKNGKDLINRTHIIDVCRTAKIIHVKTSDNLQTVLKSLFDNKILSVPVLDTRSRKYKGIIDISDCVAYLASHFDEATIKKDVRGLLAASDKKDAALEIANASKVNPWYPLDADLNVRAATDLFARRHLRRVPIIEDEQVVSLLSQTDIFDLFYKNIKLWGDLGKTPVSGLVTVKKEVISILPTDKAVTAFKLMSTKEVVAIPVVSSDGRLVGNISASDLKSLGYKFETLSLLFGSASTFLTAIGEKGSISPPITINPTDTLEEAMKVIHLNKIHRVYIVDGIKRTIHSVLTMMDIINIMFSATDSMA